jgi:hypothetical protein
MACMVARNRIYIVLCLLVAGFNATPADAQMLRCASKYLAPSDRSEAFAHARKLVPPHGGRLTLDFSCWNVDFARAEFKTPTMIEADDVQWWWYIECERGVRSWSCKPARRHREIEAHIAIDGKSHEASATLQKGMAGSRASTLLEAAASLVIQPQMPFASCSRRDDDQDLWSRYHHATLAPDAEFTGEVDLTDSGPVVDIFGWSIQIHFDQNDRPVCWDAYVVVT